MWKLTDQEHIRMTLGMTMEGVCCRHPKISIYNATSGMVHACHVCSSEKEAGGGLRHRKSFAMLIQQVQDFHADKKEWNRFKQNWILEEEDDDIEDDEDEEEKKDRDQHSQAEGKKQQQADDPHEQRLVQQILKRVAQVQDWVMEESEKQVSALQEQLDKITIAKEAEVQGLSQKVSRLQGIIDRQNEQLAVVRAQVEKQERTINHELKMIKSIAMKRAASSKKLESSPETATSEHRKAQPHTTATQLAYNRLANAAPNSQPAGLGNDGAAAGPPRPPAFNKDLSSGSLSLPPQEAPPRIPLRKRSEMNEILGQKPVTSILNPTAAELPELNANASGGTAGITKELAPKLPVRQQSSQTPAVSPASSTALSKHKASLVAKANNNLNRKVSLDNQVYNSPPTLPKRQDSQDTRMTGATGLDGHDSAGSHGSISAITSSIVSSYSNLSARKHFLYEQKLSSSPKGKPPHSGVGEVLFVPPEGNEEMEDGGETEIRLSQMDPEAVLSADATPAKRSVSYRLPPEQKQQNIQQQTIREDLFGEKSPGSSKASEPRNNSQEISFIPTEFDIAKINAGGVSSVIPEDSVPPPPTASSSDLMSLGSPELMLRRKKSSQVVEFDVSKDISFDSRDLIGYQRRKTASEMQFDPSQQLLMEASQALSFASITPMQNIRKSINTASDRATNKRLSAHIEAGKKEIEFDAAAPNPTALRTGVTQEFRNNPEKAFNSAILGKTQQQIMEELNYGKAAMASETDENDDYYDDFNDFPSDFPLVKEGYLECNRVNLSPVSQLTTGSYLLEQQFNVKSPLEVDDDEEGGPKKALHGAGFAKKLPIENDFDSDDDETGDNNDLEDSRKDSVQDNNDLLVQIEKPHPPAQQKSYHPLKSGVVSPKAQRLHGATTPNYMAAAASAVASDKRAPKRTYSVERQEVKDKYGDGGEYTGTVSFEDKLPHGFGKMEYDNNRLYEGEWRDGRWHGFGRWVNPNGDCYEGQFVYDARHGSGTYTWKNGNLYQGDFFEDKRQGKGTFNFANGNIYKGDFVNGVFEGMGRYDFEGGYYEGEWKSGRYHGHGFLLFSDGSSYMGEFLDGVAHGKGEETSAEGKVQIGYWENGKPAGAL